MTILAMWSGPRNISTAMMYAFGNRPDCIAWDEPFYAFSLINHGNDHPMRDAIIAANESDWNKLVARCTTEQQRPLFYQKHMTHHMLEGRDRDWILKLTNSFLIRASSPGARQLHAKMGRRRLARHWFRGTGRNLRRGGAETGPRPAGD